MAKTRKQLHEALRNKFLTHFAELLTNEGEEVLRTKSNEIAIPTLDEEDNEEFVVITFKVPTGSRDDGEAYDGYSMSQIYVEQCLKKEEDRRINEEKKAKKIAKDKAQREAKAKARAEHEAKRARGNPRALQIERIKRGRIRARAFVILHKYHFARREKFVQYTILTFPFICGIISM